jgi:hypothetical protein
MVETRRRQGRLTALVRTRPVVIQRFNPGAVRGASNAYRLGPFPSLKAFDRIEATRVIDGRIGKHLQRRTGYGRSIVPDIELSDFLAGSELDFGQKLKVLTDSAEL